ncbi:Mitogen-activated protein kinase kinase kinase mom-4 [Fusarium oxysporum f. sp. cubense race 1]|uniref:Mitogen-activated protein kinase kinase kinase mom-4 n=1 Tax=Fusarium oxysporum f. sp. cubense (strain race 1) TaxID=1229664 RepID=N4U1T9_FUSC1|nr:Mitogen-activated protein kinase kinase kinase mom-4 [Fusarium oxysporum f. sp. cubense race 1]
MAQAGVIASEPPQTLRSQTNALSGTQGFFRKLFGRQSGSNTPCKPTELPKSPQHEVDSADLDKGGLIRRMSRRVVPGLPRAQTFKRQVPRSPLASQPATNPRVSAPSFLGSPQDEIPRFVPSISVNDVTDEPPREPADGILHPDEEMTLADECPAQDTLSDTRSITASQYDAIIHEELEKTWILNLSMHFRDRSKREKFFVTYRERDHLWRRVTISLDYRDAPPNSLEMDLINTHYQREKSAKIYEAIRESLRDIQFYDTVTNLKLQTTDGRLHVHVVEDGNEIIQYPTVAQIKHLGCRRIRERDITFESHMSGFVYKVNVNGHTLIKKEIPSPDTIDEFLYEINALNALRSSRNVIHFYGVVVDDQDQNVKGLLINYADQGALIDVIYEHCKDGDYDLPWATRERWARQIVEGLSDIHESGFVQGDFTLSNIVIDGYGDAKIIDINRRGCPVGWEPPEATPLIESNQRITMYIGVKSDLYQLGMVLWALATQEDEPEAQGRPLILGPEVNIPDWYRQMAEVCLSNDPRMRLQASALLEMFPRQRESEETGQLNPPESIIDEGYTLHQYLVDGYHPDNLPQIRTVEPPNDWSDVGPEGTPLDETPTANKSGLIDSDALTAPDSALERHETPATSTSTPSPTRGVDLGDDLHAIAIAKVDKVHAGQGEFASSGNEDNTGITYNESAPGSTQSGNVTPGDNGTVIRDGAQDTKDDAPGERANGEKSLLSAEKGEDVGGEETKEAQALYQETGNTLEGLPKMNDSQETQMLQEGGKTEDHQTTSANERDVSEEPNTKAELDAEQNAAEKQGSTVPGTDQATMEKEMIAGKADNRENGKVTEGGCRRH